LKVVPSPKEYELITTNPDEIRAREQKLMELGTTEIENFEPYAKEKNYYLLKELNKEQVEFLKGNGFVEARLCGLGNYSQWYLVRKPESSESVEHYFMVQCIADEIRHYTENVLTYSSFGPDITFQVPKKENLDEYEWYAIEVETGTQLKTPEELQQKTAKNNTDFKYKEWWFVVTDKSVKSEYEKLGTTFTRTEIKEKIEGLFK
jgi:hypothetical protein